MQPLIPLLKHPYDGKLCITYVKRTLDPEEKEFNIQAQTNSKFLQSRMSSEKITWSMAITTNHKQSIYRAMQM